MTLDLSFQLEDDLAEAVEAIRADTVLGPIGLARLGVQAVVRLTEKTHYERPLHVWAEVQGLARALLAARPACMPLVNLASATVEPLPELYGRGKDEGARMRADVRARALEWLAALDARAARIDALRARFNAPTAYAIDLQRVWFTPPSPWKGEGGQGGEGRHLAVIAGPEKFVPPNYELPLTRLEQISLDAVAAVLTGDGDTPASPEEVRTTIATLRFAPTLL